MYIPKQIELDISDNQRILAKASENKANKHIIKATKLEFSRDMQRMRRKELKSLRKLKKGLIAVVIIEALALGYFCYKSVITSRAGEPISIEQSLDSVQNEEIPKEALKEYPPLSTPSNSYSEKDLEILSHIICGEAQSYSDELQLAVGSVVLNRVVSSKFPNTIKEVVFQRGQYACTKDGNYYREPTQKNREIAKYLLENGSQLPSNCIYQAQFKQGSGVYKKIGRTYICYE